MRLAAAVKRKSGPTYPAVGGAEPEALPAVRQAQFHELLAVHIEEAKGAVGEALNWVKTNCGCDDFHQVVVELIWKTDYSDENSVKACSAALDSLVTDLERRFPTPAPSSVETESSV
jgi:hypothetical protein